MPTFDLSNPQGETFEVEAPDEQTALQAFEQFQAGQSQDTRSQEQKDLTGGALSASTSGVASALTFDLDDEILAGVAAPFRAAGRAIVGEDSGKGFLERISDAYTTELKNQRAIKGQRREENPVASTVGEVAGGAVAGGGLAKSSLPFFRSANPTAKSLVPRAAAGGAGFGGAQGFGQGEGFEDRIARGKSGAVIGAVIGGTIGKVAARQAKKTADKVVQTVQQLRTSRDTAYAAARESGDIVPAKSFERFANKLDEQMQRQGVNLGQHPKAAGALDALVKNSRQDMALENVDLLRRNILDAVLEGSPSEARLAGQMLNKLDEFVDTFSGGAAWRQARKAHKVFRKSAMVERLVERAKLRADQFARSGMDNALQVEFRQFVRNDKLMKGFTKAERKALEAVAKNGMTTDVFRRLGKVALTSGPMANMVTLLTASFSLPLAVGLMAAGEVGKRAAIAARRGSADAALRLIRNAGEDAVPQAISAPQSQAIGGAVGATTRPVVSF